jgi:hypothetical protein
MKKYLLIAEVVFLCEYQRCTHMHMYIILYYYTYITLHTIAYHGNCFMYTSDVLIMMFISGSRNMIDFVAFVTIVACESGNRSGTTYSATYC